MKVKFIIASIFIFISIGLYSTSRYITKQLESGKAQAAKAQKNVDFGSQLFSENQYSKEIGGLFTGQIQKKIDKGNEEIKKYETINGYIQTGMWVSLAIGGLFIISGILTKKKRGS
jgi:hypothetical protein